MPSCFAKLSLSCAARQNFINSNWRFVNAFVITLWRLVVACYLIYILFYTSIKSASVEFDHRRHTWAVYLTNWTFFIVCSYFVLAAMTSILHNMSDCCRRRRQTSDGILGVHENPGYGTTSTGLSMDPPNEDAPQLPYDLRLVWFFWIVASAAGPLVTLVYFSFLFPFYTEEKYGGLRFIDFNVHGLTSILIFIELFLNDIPVFFSQFLYLVLYGTAYALFSLIYWAQDHNNVIYPIILDWNHPEVTVPVVLTLLVIIAPMIQACLWAMAAGRTSAQNRHNSRFV